MLQKPNPDKENRKGTTECVRVCTFVACLPSHFRPLLSQSLKCVCTSVSCLLSSYVSSSLSRSVCTFFSCLPLHLRTLSLSLCLCVGVGVCTFVSCFSLCVVDVYIVHTKDMNWHLRVEPLCVQLYESIACVSF